MITIDQTKLEEFEKITLAKGDHDAREQGMCAMEAAAWLAGEEHSAAPQCVDPAIARVMIRLNDRLGSDDRQLLKPYVRKALGTRTTTADTIARGFVAADYAIRQFAPTWLELAGMSEEAEQMRSLARVVDKATADAGRKLSREIREKTWAKCSEARARLIEKAKAAVKDKLPAAADADAYAAAYAAAAAAAAAAAYAAADAYAAAYAAADRRKIYGAVYAAVKKRLDEALAPMLARRLPDVLEMLDAMIAVGAK